LDEANTFVGAQAVTPVDLDGDADIETDASLGNTFRFTLSGDYMLMNPTNLVDGQELKWIVTQDSSGGRTLSFDNQFYFEDGVVPVLSNPSSGSPIDVIFAKYDDSLGVLLAWARTNFQPGPGPGDPFFGDTVLLLHFDGTNGSSTFTDSSGAARTMTAQNGAVITTSQSVFGGAAGDFTAANNAHVQSPSSVALALNGDFCIEFRLRMTSVAGGIYVMGGSGAGNFWVYTDSSGTLNCAIFGSTFSASAAIAIDTWYDVKIRRTGGTIYFVVDGSVVSSRSEAGQHGAVAQQWTIGAAPSLAGASAGGRCYFDEFRMTIGNGRDNTVATEPFSDV
jgi:hypothetical protein